MMRTSDLVAPEITYHTPQVNQSPSSRFSSLVRPHGPSAQPPATARMGSRNLPSVVTPVPAPKPPALGSANRSHLPPARTDRNIDKVVLGDLCFKTWYPSYYGKELLGDLTSGSHSKAAVAGSAASGGKEDSGKTTSNKKGAEGQPPLERLYVCPSCFKYSKELVPWWGHVRVCERRGEVPGRKVYVHPQGKRKVLVPQGGMKSVTPKRKRGEGSVKYVEQMIEDEGEWSIWEVDGEKERLFCQNLSLFGKLFLDNKSVFFDVKGFNYFLLAYTPPQTKLPGGFPDHMAERPKPQVVGFFSKEKMSWDNNNLACILIFPPWQRKGLGVLLMGASYEISKREGIKGGPEKPISDLGRKGYRRFWAGEIARWLLSLEPDTDETDAETEIIVDVKDCSDATWISLEDCLQTLREMELIADAGIGPPKPIKKEPEEDEEEAEEASDPVQGEEVEEEAPVQEVPRVKVDKEAVRRYVAAHKINLERTCDAESFVEGYAIKDDRSPDDDDEMEE